MPNSVLQELDDALFRDYESLNSNLRLERICTYVQRYLFTKGDRHYYPAVLLLAALAEGTDPTHLAEFCRLDLDIVEEIQPRMLASGIWMADGTVNYDFVQTPGNQSRKTALIIDIWVARGWLKRTGSINGNIHDVELTEIGRGMLMLELDEFGSSTEVH